MKGVSFTKGIGKHGNGSWYMRCRINGHEIIKAFQTRLDAENALKALKTQKKAADLGLTTIEPGETLKSLSDRYVADAEARGLSPVTIVDYRKIADRLVAHFGKRHHPRFQQAEIMGYVKARRNAGAGARLITRELKLLSTFLKNTVGQAYLTWSVPRLVDTDENTPKPIPADAEIAWVYDSLKDRPDVQRAFLLALLCALRPTDVFNLHSSDITDEVMVIGMRKRRGTPIAIPVVATLRNALNGVTGPLTPTADAVKMTLQRKTKKQKFTWNGLGHLRPTAATWASEAGFPDEDIDTLLGHSIWTLARKSYIRSPKLVLTDPLISRRREMLQAVETRFLASL